MKLYLSAAIIMFFLLSCNHALFVDKKDIIHNQKGYILFYYENEEALFFPSNDTIDSKFLSQNHLNGYRLGAGEKDLDYLKKLAISQTVQQNVVQNSLTMQVDNTLLLIPVNVKYYWGENIKLKLQKVIDNKNEIKYEYANEGREFFYQLYDHRYIISITPTRKSDKIRVDEYIPEHPKN